MNVCHACKKEVILEVAVGRLDTCPSCFSYLHCCLNCKFYEPGYQNDCREPLSAFVRDRGDANFCHFWRFKDSEPEDEDEKLQAINKLEDLFKNLG